MGQVMSAVRMIRAAHQPFPAVAMDRAWNVRMSNRLLDSLGASLGEDPWERVGGDQAISMFAIIAPLGAARDVTATAAGR